MNKKKRQGLREEKPQLEGKEGSREDEGKKTKAPHPPPPQIKKKRKETKRNKEAKMQRFEK